MSGTTYDDPNREALGLPPIWTGAGAAAKKASAKADEPKLSDEPKPKADDVKDTPKR